MSQRLGISSTNKLTSQLRFGVLLGFYRAYCRNLGMLVSSSCFIGGKELVAYQVLYKIIIRKHIFKRSKCKILISYIATVVMLLWFPVARQQHGRFFSRPEVRGLEGKYGAESGARTAGVWCLRR